VQAITKQMTRAQKSKASVSGAPDLRMLRMRVSDALNQLGAQLIARVADAQTFGTPPDQQDEMTALLQSRVAVLGQIAAGLAIIDVASLPATGAGFGSLVQVRDVDSGVVSEYTLMVGSVIDIDANQVSLASPIGQALLGKKVGDQITITTPHREARLLITGVTTLMESLEADLAPAPAR